MSELVNGNIPARQACPFVAECNMLSDRCPTTSHIKPHEFSCAMARLHVACRRTNNATLIKIRDSFPANKTERQKP